MKNLKMKLILGLALALAFTTACKSEVDNKPAAEVVDTKKAEGEAKPADEKPAEAKPEEGAAKTEEKKAEGATALTFDAAGSTIAAVGAKVTGDHTLNFSKFDGKATLNGDQPGSIEFTVDMAEFKTDSEKLDGHLKSADFFDVEKYPTATFKSTKIEKGDQAAFTHNVEGEMTLRGATKTIKFPANITMDDKGVTGTSEFTINRKDFGIEYPGKPDDLIKDDVLIKLSLKFNK